MADGQTTFEVKFQFPNEELKQAFQRQFQAWVQQQERDMMIELMSQGSGGGQQGGGAGLQGSGQGERYGYGDSDAGAGAGLISWGGGGGGGYSSGPFYLNFIGGW